MLKFNTEKKIFWLAQIPEGRAGVPQVDPADQHENREQVPKLVLDPHQNREQVPELVLDPHENRQQYQS